MSITTYVILIFMRKLIIHVILYTVYSILYTSNAYASSEFSTSYDSTYTFDETGSAKINHKIEIKNKLAHIYTTKYSLGILSGNISNIETLVNNHIETSTIDQTSSTTNIHLPITNPSIGKDQITRIEVNYESQSFAEKIGNTLSIALPKSEKGNEAEYFVRTVKIPLSLPEYSYSSLKPQSVVADDTYRTYTFVGSGQDNIKLLIGDKVTYKLTLSFDIKNTSNNSGYTEIALPPDTPYQQVHISRIEPSPVEIVVDPDGNWLARYNLSYLEKKTVQAELYITVVPSPINFDPSTSLPTKSDQFWEQSKSVVELSEQLKTPDNIYHYLVDNFTFDYSRINARDRLGSEKALNSPNSAICTEFSDTFVAMLRSLKIPARSVIGYAYSTDPNLRPQNSSQDILHAYPEYYDDKAKLWRAVDPTWASTTGGVDYFNQMDFSHIAFVRLGQESSYPLPAGSYRNNDSLAKQIMVEVVDSPPEKISKLEQVNDSYLNLGSNALTEIEGKAIYIPPYGKHSIELKAPPTSKNLKIVITCIIILCAVLLLKYLLPWPRFIRPKL